MKEMYNVLSGTEIVSLHLFSCSVMSVSCKEKTKRALGIGCFGGEMAACVKVEKNNGKGFFRIWGIWIAWAM